MIKAMTLLLGLTLSSSAAAGISPRSLNNFDAAEAQIAHDYGADAATSIHRWHLELNRSRFLNDQEKISRINQFFNQQVVFDEDNRIWRKADYWATPLETLIRARGDCEDFSIAKYMSLRMLNIPADQMQLTFVMLEDSPEQAPRSHMVLAYFPEGNGARSTDPLILDNMSDQVLPASARTDLKPVFSFNDEALWVKGKVSPIKPDQRLKRWRDLLDRMQASGL